jgi:hypothetical protein
MHAYAGVPSAILNPLPKPSRFQNFYGAFKNALPASIALGGRAGIGRAAAIAAGKAFPQVAIPLAVASEAKRALTESIRGLRDFAENLVNANRHFALYNADIANAYATLSLGDYRRNVQTATATAPGLTNLVRAVDDLRDSMQPFRIASANLQNALGSFGAGALGEALDKLQFIPNFFNNLYNATGTSAGDVGSGAVNAIVYAFWSSPGAVLLSSTLGALQEFLKGWGIDIKKWLQNNDPKGQPLGPWNEFFLQQMGAGRQGPMNPRFNKPPFQ